MAPPEQRVTHLTLDGHRYLLGGPFDLTAPATSTVEIAISGRRHELTAGIAGLGDDVATALGIDEFDERLTFAGGTLLIARTRPYDARIRLTEDRLTAVWRGRSYSFVTHLYGASTADLLGVLRTVRIEEYDDGLVVRPASGSAFTRRASLTKEVPGLGLLDISPLTMERRRQLPRWRGLSTAAGELFADNLSDGSPYFVLAGADTWVTVLPLADTVLDRVPDLVGRLRLSPAA